MIEPWMIRVGAVVVISGAVNLGLLWVEARLRRAGMIPPNSETPASIAVRRIWNQSQESGRGLMRWTKSNTKVNPPAWIGGIAGMNDCVSGTQIEK